MNVTVLSVAAPLGRSTAAQSQRRCSSSQYAYGGVRRSVQSTRRQLSSALAPRLGARRNRARVLRAVEEETKADPDAIYPNGPVPSLFETVNWYSSGAIFLIFITGESYCLYHYYRSFTSTILYFILFTHQFLNCRVVPRFTTTSLYNDGLHVTDFSGLGPVLAASVNAPAWLALLQLSLFVAPTVAFAASRGYSLTRTFSLLPAPPSHYAAAAAGGACLWTVVSAYIFWKSGNGGVAADGAELAYRLVEGSSTIFSAPDSLGSWASLIGFGALLPAISEELLFRGFLLSALRRRLKSIDAAMLSAVLFAVFHLSPSQFAPLSVLGVAAGLAAVATGSVGPAIALHFGHNAAALAYGAALSDGWVVAAAPGGAAAAAAAGGLALCAVVLSRGGPAEGVDANTAEKK